MAGTRTDDPATMALAALHRDGRVRAAAVDALLSTGRPEALPFIAVRAAVMSPHAFERLTRRVDEHLDRPSPAAQ